MLRFISFTLMALLLALPLAGWWFVVRTLPSYDGIVGLPQLSEDATVHFDGRGVPYINARNTEDLYLAQGYITARDRMFQMDILRRMAAGKLSEIFGASTVPSDRLNRTLGLSILARSETQRLSPEVKNALDAYCRGVNLYLLDNFKRLPVEFTLLRYKPEPWTAEDTVAICKYLAYSQEESWHLDDLRQRVLDSAGQSVYTQLFNEKAAPAQIKADKRKDLITSSQWSDKSYFFGRPRPTWGSTAWILSGRYAGSSGTLVSGDKHGPFSSPDLWYLTFLGCPELKVAGATIPGVPGIMLGRNEKVSWVSSAFKADVQDLFVEKLSPRFPNQYKTVSGWKSMDSREEIIPVRFGKDIVHRVFTTEHGPVLLKDKEKAIALSWSGMKTSRSSLETIWRLNRADSWDSFKSALNVYPGPVQTFLFADLRGNVGEKTAGRIPVRAGATTGSVLVPGWKEEGQWTETVPFGELPESFNPESGFVVAANQKPQAGGDRYYFGRRWAAPYRDRRIREVLTALTKAGKKAGLPDMNDLQADQFAQLSPLVNRELTKAIENTQIIDTIQLSAAEMLGNWDGQVKAASPAASIYEGFKHTLARRIIVPKIGAELTDQYFREWPGWPEIVEQVLQDKGSNWLPPEERTYPAFLLTTFAETLKNLNLTFGKENPETWLWEKVHRATFRHILTLGIDWSGFIFDIGPVGVAGDSDTVDCCDIGEVSIADGFTAKAGPTLRLLIDMSDSSKLYGSVSLGQSGQIFSPFHKDQLKNWLDVVPIPVAFSEAQIEKQSQHKLLLTRTPPAN